MTIHVQQLSLLKSHGNGNKFIKAQGAQRGRVWADGWLWRTSGRLRAEMITLARGPHPRACKGESQNREIFYATAQLCTFPPSQAAMNSTKGRNWSDFRALKETDQHIPKSRFKWMNEYMNEAEIKKQKKTWGTLSVWAQQIPSKMNKTKQNKATHAISAFPCEIPEFQV